MAVSKNQLLLPNINTTKAVRGAGINAVSSSLIFVDNDAFNSAAEKFFSTGRSNFSDQMERLLQRATGFRGNATDVSGKADFQNFVLNLNPTDIENLGGAAQSFVATLLRSAQGETYDSPNTVDSTGATFGGVGVEAKFSRVVLQQQAGGQFRALGSTGLQQFERGSNRVASASTGKTIAQRTVGSTLQLEEGATADFSAAALKEKGFANSSEFYSDLLYDRNGIATKLFGTAGAASIKLIRLKARNVFTQITLRGIKGTRRNFIYLIEGIKPNPEDFSGNWDSSKRTLQWKFDTKFEKKLEAALFEQLGDIATKALDSKDFISAIANSASGCLILGNKGTINGLDGISFEGTIDRTSSIPIRSIAKVSVKETTRTRKRQTSIQETISSTQLTDSVRRSLRARMPKGPRRGPPLSPNILTNRTGRFVNSVFTEVRGELIRYYYNPIYQVHEDTARNPSRTVEESIRNITQQRVGRQFNLVKGI